MEITQEMAHETDIDPETDLFPLVHTVRNPIKAQSQKP